MANAGLGKTPALAHYIEECGPFEQKVMIGDSLNDMSDARAVNMKAVLYDADNHYSNVDVEVDGRISDLQEIIEYIR